MNWKPSLGKVGDDLRLKLTQFSMGNEVTDYSCLKREPSKTRGRGLSFFF